MEKQCPVCGKLFFTKAERKFCSRGCYGKNEGERRHGTAHPTFRPVPNYGTIHKWASSQWTKSGSCEYCCKVVGRTEWANIDGYYGREQDGWAELCAPCHRYLDSPSGTVAKTQFWLAREGNAPWG